MSQIHQPEGDPGPREIRILDLLIRESRNDTKVENVSAESLRDYAEGRSTPEEARVLQQKLLSSAGLRDELAHLAELSDPETQARFDAEKVPDMKWMLWKHGLRRRLSSLGRIVLPAPVRRPVILVPAAAALAVAAALFLILRPAPAVSPWSSAPPLLNAMFVRDPLRGEALRPEPAVDAEQAAVYAFRAVAEWKDGAFILHEAGAPAAGGKPVSVTIRGAAAVYTAAIPDEADDESVWFLSLPSLNRYAIAAGSASPEFTWPDREARRGLLTITYRSGNEYRATPAGEARR